MRVTGFGMLIKPNLDEAMRLGFYDLSKIC